MRTKLLYIIAVLLLASCEKRDFYIPETDDGQIIERPGQAIATVTGTIPGNAQVFFYTPGKPSFNAVTGVPIDMEAGTYQVVIVADYENVEINGITASLPTTEDGETIQAPAFYAGVGNIIIKEGEVAKLSIPVHPMTREVRFQFSVSGMSTDEIQSMEVLLYGILSQCNLNEGFSESSTSRSATPLYYVRTVPKQIENNYYSSIRLLGIDKTQKQKVTIQITGNNGSIYTFTEDVSIYLSDFNQGYADMPLTMKTQVNLNLNEMTGNIKPWKPGNEDDIPME